MTDFWQIFGTDLVDQLGVMRGVFVGCGFLLCQRIFPTVGSFWYTWGFLAVEDFCRGSKNFSHPWQILLAWQKMISLPKK
jgi:hypothetical protein